MWPALQAERFEQQQLEVIEVGAVVSSELVAAQGVPSASAESSGCWDLKRSLVVFEL